MSLYIHEAMCVGAALRARNELVDELGVASWLRAELLACVPFSNALVFDEQSDNCDACVEQSSANFHALRRMNINHLNLLSIQTFVQ